MSMIKKRYKIRDCKPAWRADADFEACQLPALQVIGYIQVTFLKEFEPGNCVDTPVLG